MKCVDDSTVGKRPTSGAAKVPRVKVNRPMCVPVLRRDALSGLIEPVPCPYAGPVPPLVWRNMNQQLLKLHSAAYFYPGDPMDAYGEAVRAVTRRAEGVSRGEIVLRKATADTYLTSVAYKTFLQFHLRQVKPLRDLYRRDGDSAAPEDDAASSSGDDDQADREWAVHGTSAAVAQDAVERCAGPHSADRIQAMRLAAACVDETLARLDDDARRGLRAWLDADGVWVDAARRYNPSGSVQGYVYRFRNLWAKAFREACTWAW